MSRKDPTGASAPGKTFSGVGERSYLTFDTHNQPPVLPLLFSSDKQANFFPVSVQIQSLGYHPGIRSWKAALIQKRNQAHGNQITRARQLLECQKHTQKHVSTF